VKIHDISDSDDVSSNTIDSILDSVHNKPENFVGGKISQFLRRWKSLTSDKWILDVINGNKIEFEQLPKQSWKPKELVFSVE
jgi:hypothetical protein